MHLFYLVLLALKLLLILLLILLIIHSLPSPPSLLFPPRPRSFCTADNARLTTSRNPNPCFRQGVGGEDLNSLKVQSGELAWLELSSTKLERVRSLFGGNGGLDLVGIF